MRICRESRAVVRGGLNYVGEVPGLIQLVPEEAGVCQLAVALLGGTVGEVTGRDKGGQ